jgi:hypothetical protein
MSQHISSGAASGPPNGDEYTVTITQACRSKSNPRSILPCSRVTAYAWIEAGVLPQPIAFGPRLRGWPVQVLREWLASQQSK